MVAHCSDFFHVWASSSFLVLTASSNKLILSYKNPKTKAPTCFAMVVTLSLISFSSPNIKTQFRGNYKISQAVTMKHKTPHAEVYKIKC